jgi:hypothetical protein
MGQEGLDFGTVHGLGMLLVMKQNKVLDPMEILLFGAISIVLGAQRVAHLIK